MEAFKDHSNWLYYVIMKIKNAYVHHLDDKEQVMLYWLHTCEYEAYKPKTGGQ